MAFMGYLQIAESANLIHVFCLIQMLLLKAKHMMEIKDEQDYTSSES